MEGVGQTLRDVYRDVIAEEVQDTAPGLVDIMLVQLFNRGPMDLAGILLEAVADRSALINGTQRRWPDRPLRLRFELVTWAEKHAAPAPAKVGCF